MIKKYPKLISSKTESEIGPSIQALKFIVNYSKSLEVKKSTKNRVLYHLN